MSKPKRSYYFFEIVCKNLNITIKVYAIKAFMF